MKIPNFLAEEGLREQVKAMRPKPVKSSLKPTGEAHITADVNNNLDEYDKYKEGITVW